MHKTKDKLYEQIKDLKTKKQFQEEINKIKEEYDDLLDEDALALLIIDELGRNKQSICKISELISGSECSVVGKILDIKSAKNFNRKNGTSGKVVNLELSDETGKCLLALWDNDVEFVTNKLIKIGSNIKVINGYVKDGFKGKEISIGRWGLLEVQPENTIESKKDKNKTDTIIGKIIEIEPTRAFFRDDGEFGFVTNIKLDISNEKKLITIWGEKVKEIQKLKKGEKIEIKNFSFKLYNGKEEIHLNSKGEIKKI
jgi:replication factor A1